ncbi:MAG: arsenate reductase family protein [Tissierellia bacterium]|nr:arsenate reductase family protein [Tissierellia bacterium]MDD4726054.1 arsenate reductase family protein [Tissierellia bacterium]
MKYLFICYPKCSTCNKAKKYLDESNIDYELRDIKKDNPNKDELKEWIEKSGLPIKKFFNTSGTIYKTLNLKDKLASMTDDEKVELLATDGMLVKRPILVGENKVLVAFKEAEWDNSLNNGGNGHI